jgi:hypothetical protein
LTFLKEGIIIGIMQIKDTFKAFRKISESQMTIIKYEVAPGLVMTVRFEDDDDTVTRFLKRRASFRELRKMR